MRIDFVTADIFTDRPFSGNPVAVIPDGRGLTTGQMQRLAREFNLSETVFVLPAQDPDHHRRLRIFVPTAEIPFAGHPTIGAAMVLAATGGLELAGDRTAIVLETEAGPVPVTIAAEDGRPVAATLRAPEAPTIRPAPPLATVAALLSLDPDQVLRAGAASCGLPFVLVELEDRAALAAARIDPAVDQRNGPDLWARDPYLFTADAANGFDIQARMFAPAAGIPEDPATGSAAAALGGWLGVNDPLEDGTLRRTIAQGIEMGRPSRLDVEVDKRAGQVIAVRVTGKAVLISEGRIERPED